MRKKYSFLSHPHAYCFDLTLLMPPPLATTPSVPVVGHTMISILIFLHFPPLKCQLFLPLPKILMQSFLQILVINYGALLNSNNLNRSVLPTNTTIEPIPLRQVEYDNGVPVDNEQRLKLLV